MKTSKVTNVQSEGTWQSPNGLMYKWEVSFENGDHGQAMTKDQEHKTWMVGQEINYELTPNSNPKFLGKLTKVKEPFVAQPNAFTSSNLTIQGTPHVNTQNLIVAQNSITNAVKFLESDTTASDKDVIEYAEKFYSWVMSKG